jgi:hypothetical protein
VIGNVEHAAAIGRITAAVPQLDWAPEQFGEHCFFDFADVMTLAREVWVGTTVDLEDR